MANDLTASSIIYVDPNIRKAVDDVLVPIFTMLFQRIGAAAAATVYSGNPNGNVAGDSTGKNNPALCVDPVDQQLWICTTTGTAAQAVWQPLITLATSAEAVAGTNATALVTPSSLAAALAALQTTIDTSMSVSSLNNRPSNYFMGQF